VEILGHFKHPLKLAKICVGANLVRVGKGRTNLGRSRSKAEKWAFVPQIDE
jgi:hypothetical protein